MGRRGGPPDLPSEAEFILLDVSLPPPFSDYDDEYYQAL
eukprot:gene539-267_t